ncbi:MAG: purine phosphorylase [Kiloniellaceae bacterium]
MGPGNKCRDDSLDVAMTVHSPAERENQTGAARTLGVVTGLASEAVVANALLGGGEAPVAIACAGASAERARQHAQQLVEGGVAALMSFGIAGAVDPALNSGDLVIADDVLLDEFGNCDHFTCDRAWVAALRAALDAARVPHHGGLLIGSQRLWRDPADKQAIHEITEAVAVDMESAAVAAVAAEAGLPFLAVRAVADTARDCLPALAENAVKPDGMPAVGRAVAGLIRRPWDLPAMLKLARQSELALARLRQLEEVREVLFGGF